MRTDSVFVYVRDQKEALTFYRDVFGFEVVLDRPVDDVGERWIEMVLPQDSVRLVLSSVSGARHFGQSIGGWTNIIFSVDSGDLRVAVREMSEAGATVVEGPQSLEWGEWAVVADPDGNQFGLSAPKTNGT